LGIESLQVRPISKAAARQRSGRAGREVNYLPFFISIFLRILFKTININQSAGITYRLYTEDDYLKLEPTSIPEIKR